MFIYVSTTAPPMIAPIVIVTPLSSTSFSVSWTLIGPDHIYILIWTNLRTGMMDSMTVAENTNSYTITGLSGMDNYNVTVTASNSCGMMMSDPRAVYGKSYVCNVASNLQKLNKYLKVQ